MVVDNSKESTFEKSLRADGWANIYSSVGRVGFDKTEGNFFQSPLETFDDESLTRIYTYDGLASAIINRPANDMTKNWFSVEGDENGAIQEELKRIKAHTQINQAIKWTRLYRGCIIWMLFENDNKAYDTPVNLAKIRGIKALRVYPANRVPITNININANPDSEYFDEVEIFPIQTLNGNIINVHESRCLVFKGLPVPDDTILDWTYRYWGLPVIVQIWERLSNYGVIEKGICSLMQEAVIGKYTLDGLANLIAQNDTKAIHTRIGIINTAKSVINAVLLGENESYERDTLNLSGIEGIVDRGMMNLSAVCQIPVTLLFGRSPAGENATGDSDFQAYYDMISAEQDNWLYYNVKKLVDFIAAYTNVNNPKVVFNPLEKANEKGQAEIRKLNTEADKIDMDMGLYMAEDILKRRGEMDE